MSRSDPHACHTTNLARWLTLAYVCVVVYVTLHPVGAIRWMSVTSLLPLGFVFKPWTLVGVTAFDVWANVLAYIPLGFGLAWLLAQGRQASTRRRTGASAPALWLSIVLLGALSFALESVQSYSPVRVASLLDVGCNTAGAALGAALATLLKGRQSLLGGVLNRCIAPHCGALWAVLGLWALAQLHPQDWAFMTAPLATLTDAWLPSQRTHGLGFPLATAELKNLETVTTVVAVAGVLALLRLGLNRQLGAAGRLFALLLGFAALLLWQFLVYWLQYGWDEWRLLASGGVMDALSVLVVVVLAWAVLPSPGVAVGAVVCLALHTALAQMLPSHPYSPSAALWQQGRLVHAYGLTGLVSAAWPILALAALVLQSRYKTRD